MSLGTDADSDCVPNSQDSTDFDVDLADTSSNKEAAPAPGADGLIESAPLLILKKTYLDAILEKRKTLEIRSQALAPGKRFLGCNGVVHGWAAFGEPQNIKTDAAFRMRFHAFGTRTP